MCLSIYDAFFCADLCSLPIPVLETWYIRSQKKTFSENGCTKSPAQANSVRDKLI